MIYPTPATAARTLRHFVKSADLSTPAAVLNTVLFVCGYTNCLLDHYGPESDEFSILENWAADITQNVNAEDAVTYGFLRSYPFHAE